MYRRYWGVEPTPKQREWAATEAAAAAKRLIAAHHGARARAEARDRRIRDEDLALGGRPRLNAGNCQAMMQNEWGWW